MKWVQRIIESVCRKLEITKISNNEVHTGKHIVRVLNEDDLFSINIVDLVGFNCPTNIKHIYHDDLEYQLEKIVNRLVVKDQSILHSQ